MEMISDEMKEEIIGLGGEMAQACLNELYKVAEERGLPFAVAVMSEMGQVLCAKSLSIATDDKDVFERLLESSMRQIERMSRDMSEDSKNMGNQCLN